MVIIIKLRMFETEILPLGNEAWDDYIEYVKYRANFNVEVDVRVNGAIGTIVTKWDLILFGKWIVLIMIKSFFYPINMHLSTFRLSFLRFYDDFI